MKGKGKNKHCGEFECKHCGAKFLKARTLAKHIRYKCDKAREKKPGFEVEGA